MVGVLDNIRSMHNVGSIFRTADGVGVEKLYLCGYTPAPIHEQLGHYRPQIDKVALGAQKWIAWEQRKQTWRVLDELKKRGYFIIALEKNDVSISLDRLSFKDKNIKKEKIALVVGNEVSGLGGALTNRADVVAHLPMLGEKSSLNVSVAFGAAAYYIHFRYSS